MTAHLVRILLQSSFYSPHRALDHLITSYADILPWDSAVLIKEEPELTGFADIGVEAVLTQHMHWDTFAGML